MLAVALFPAQQQQQQHVCIYENSTARADQYLRVRGSFIYAAAAVYTSQRTGNIFGSGGGGAGARENIRRASSHNNPHPKPPTHHSVRESNCCAGPSEFLFIFHEKIKIKNVGGWWRRIFIYQNPPPPTG
jgi:hypothetical protein